MKLRKIFAAMTASALALSMLAVSAAADVGDTEDPVSPDVKEDVKVLYDGKLDNTELTLLDLGKGIDGAKLRFTYTSVEEEGYGAVGIAGKATDDDWTWMQSPDNPALPSGGSDVEVVAEYTYEEFAIFAGIEKGYDAPVVELEEEEVPFEKQDLRCYVFMNWGLGEDDAELETEANSCKIELVTPHIDYGVMEVYNGPLDNTKIKAAELGMGIEGAVIRFTYTPTSPSGWGAVGLAGHNEGDWAWKSVGTSLASKGEGVEAVVEMSYADFETLAGIGSGADLECFVFQDWGLGGSNFKIEVLIPAAEGADTVSVKLFDGLLEGDVELTLNQLGKDVDGSKIRITYYVEDLEVEEAVVGICGKTDSDWYTGVHCLAMNEDPDDNVYESTYDEFFDFVGIEETIHSYVFQNWTDGLEVECTIELIIPVAVASEV